MSLDFNLSKPLFGQILRKTSPQLFLSKADRVRAMTTNAIRRFGLIEKFVTDRNRRDEGIRAPQAPNDRVREIAQCYVINQNLNLCLNPPERPLLRSSLFRHPRLTIYGSDLAETIILEGERAIPYSDRASYRALLERTILRTHQYRRLPPSHKRYLFSLIDFYSNQMRVPTQDLIPSPLPDPLPETRATYSESLPPLSRTVRDSHCSEGQWARHPIRIAGLSRSFNVYIEQSEQIHWERYEVGIREYFDLAKIFFSPIILNRILETRSPFYDFSIAIGSDSPESPIRNCGLGMSGAEPYAGRAHAYFNQLILREYRGTLWASDEKHRLDHLYSTNSGISTFIHELAHFVDYALSNHEARANLRALRGWITSHTNPHNWVNAHNAYLPDSCGANDDGTPHCLDNAYEMFADLAEEYVMHTLFGPHLEEEQNLTSLERHHLNARMQIMRSALQADGFHPEAFSLENIARAYQENGVPLTVEELENHSRSSWTADAHLSAAGNYTSHDNTPLQAGLSLGLQVRTTSTTTPNFTAGLFQTGFYPWGGQTLLELGIATPDHPNFRAELQGFGGLGYGAPVDETHLLVGAGLQLRYSFTSPNRYAEWGIVAGGRWLIDPSTGTQTWQANAGLALSSRALSF